MKITLRYKNNPAEIRGFCELPKSWKISRLRKSLMNHLIAEKYSPADGEIRDLISETTVEVGEIFG